MGGTIAEGILIPLGRSLVTGTLAGLVSWSVGALWGWTQHNETALAVGTVAALLAWLRLLPVEKMDNSAPLTEFETTPVQSVIIVPDGGNGYERLTRLWDIIDPEQFHQLADKVYNAGLDFTLSNFAGPGALLSRG